MQEKLSQFVNNLTELGYIIADEAVESIQQGYTELEQTTLVVALTALTSSSNNESSPPIEGTDNSEQAPIEPII